MEMDELILKAYWNKFEKDIEFSCGHITSFYSKINSMDNDELELFRKKLKYPENVDVKKLLREKVFNALSKEPDNYDAITPDNASNDSGISAHGRIVTHPESFYDGKSDSGSYEIVASDLDITDVPDESSDAYGKRDSGSYECVASGSKNTDLPDGSRNKIYVNDVKQKRLSRHMSCLAVHSNDRTVDETTRPLSYPAREENYNRSMTNLNRLSDTHESMRFPPPPLPAHSNRNGYIPPLPPRHDQRNSKIFY